jgi:hypothetical protein
MTRGSNTAQIAEYSLTPDEVEYALFDEHTFDVRDSSGRPIAFGSTGTGRFIAVVFEVLNPAGSARHPPDQRLRRPRADGVKP